MTETTDTAGSARSSKGGGLSAKLMPELKQIATGLGIKTAGLKKADLVAAIRGAQGGGQSGSAGSDRRGQEASREQRPERDAPADRSPRTEQAPPREQSGDASADRAERAQDRERPADGEGGGRRTRNRGQKNDGQKNDGQKNDGQKNDGQKNDGQKNDGQKNDGQKQDGQRSEGQRNDGQRNDGQKQDGQNDGGRAGRNDQRGRNDGQKQSGKGQDRQDQQPKQDQSGKQDQQAKDRQDQQAKQDQNRQDAQDDDEQGGRRNRRRRGRDRQRVSGNRSEPDTTVLEDDVLTPCAGILDVLDNYAFVRTSGYLAGNDDVYVSLSMVRKFGLRRGDAITGQVRQPREGERREKFNPLVQIDTVNGADPESAEERVEFGNLTPVHPTDRLRMETGPQNLVGRVIDLLAPIGKGQRGLVLSPPRAGKTRVLRAVAAAITANNPECHLMIVLLDERPEEVTDFQRSVKGEVIASTFDQQPIDHTTVAELAIERAKRLVELGHDVVVLLDGLTRLGRAYDLSQPSGGRSLAGGVDAAALHPTKHFFGAARNIENGGSLTILATAQVETGSATDEVFLEATAGAANMELWLRGDVAAQRVFPAVDVLASGTRREEELLSREEIAIVGTLRRSLADLEPKKGVETLLTRLGSTQTNYEFLVAVQRGE
ncbi:transcription termination factor Rho [Alteromonas gracilis]